MVSKATDAILWDYDYFPTCELWELNCLYGGAGSLLPGISGAAARLASPSTTQRHAISRLRH